MTQAARKVLEDCKGALADFHYGIQGGEWRRRWITSVVLLRTAIIYLTQGHFYAIL